MKPRDLMLVMLLSSTMSAFGQDYDVFKFGIGMGLNVNREGNLAYIEPMWRLSDNWAIGFRDEAMGGKNSFIVSGTLNTQWYLSHGRVRPFLGAGMGYYLLSTDALGVIGQWSFGAYPRAGIDVGHFTLTVDYNWISQQLPEKVTFLGYPMSQTPDRTSSYLAVKVGCSIGGGRRKDSIRK